MRLAHEANGAITPTAFDPDANLPPGFAAVTAASFVGMHTEVLWNDGDLDDTSWEVGVLSEAVLPGATTGQDNLPIPRLHCP